jgi:ABC-type uncharacterized transport system substrate-binding protein
MSVGILIPESGTGESEHQGTAGRAQRTWVQRRENIVVEIRDAKGDRGALKSMANDLVSKKVDLIFTTGTRSTQAAMAATSDIPIVFRYPGNPEIMGLVRATSGLEGT